MSGAPRHNALANETSPYLLQHADNPVEWYPWGQEALKKANEENKPILLSIGYSACHWCHVMAHESFEDTDTAQLMNALFVNIKVDREERPDLDKIYQTAHQLLTRRAGGWPLTMFLSSDNHTPFFGGTYFPKEPRHGLPAFKDILERVAQFHTDNHDALAEQNASLMAAMEKLTPAPAAHDASLTGGPLDTARLELQHSFDREHGGFGAAPKFPLTTNLERLLRHYAVTAASGQTDEAALAMVAFTLRRMALGGLYDQVGGGFCRYSVDQYWMIPHFEKMLYDNGPLLALYSEAWQVTGDPLFRRVVLETADWVMREMQSPEGGYYSTLDADSEGEEGKFYVWTPEEVRGLLTDEEYAVIARRFGLERTPNFEGKAWHFHVYAEATAVAQSLGLDSEVVGQRIARAREKLFAAREKRVRPARDEKILTAWNALMIRGMAVAGRVLGDDRLIHSAERSLEFVRAHLWKDGRLLATYKSGYAHLAAYLDDYAFLIDGILKLLESRWREEDLNLATELAEVLLTKFQDEQNGGFYFTASDHEKLIHRPKPLVDDALPAGNAIAAQALGRLGHLLGELRYLNAAEQTLRAAWPGISAYPHAHTSMLLALEEYLYPPETVVLRGTPPELQAWQTRCQAHYAPRRLCFSIPLNATGLRGTLAERVPKGRAVAYVCRGHQCSAPITEMKTLEDELAKSEVGTH